MTCGLLKYLPCQELVFLLSVLPEFWGMNKKIQAIELNNRSNRENIDTPNTHIHDRLFCWDVSNSL